MTVKDVQDAPLSQSEPAHQDEPLVRAFLVGDVNACRTIEGWIRGIIRRNPYGLPPDEIEDVVQQSLVSLWRACSSKGFRLRSALSALARTVTLARCIDRLRRRKLMVELDEALPDPGAGPEDHAQRADEWGHVRRALARLGAPCQDLVRLHFFEERSYGEIARRLGRVEATLRVRMFQCMKQIRRLLTGVRATE